ncbi:contractile injection system tape measure protein [Pararhodonellum marinum]|uniref:contractile injection system tape measure protein n=1 Tax=Pararhodonellum marinum TaxID=2755358 RepID=UPI00188F5749|nr:contractile injection system tape measure protein [Pararhodonellum marinum]
MADKDQLTKVLIHAYDDRGLRIKSRITRNPISLPVNPENFTQKYSLALNRSNQEGFGDFKVVNPRDLKLDFIFDGTQTIQGYVYNGKDTSVKAQLEIFMEAVYRKEGSVSYPRYLKVQWGNFIFPCVLADLELNYTMFAPNGEPLRIQVTTSFLDFRGLEEVNQGPKESAAEQVLLEKAKDLIDQMLASKRNPEVFLSKSQPEKENRMAELLNVPITKNDPGHSEHKDKKDGEKESNGDKDQKPITINTGVILLHPFLNELFTKLELMKGSNFKNRSSRSKGALLLHFLATGNEKMTQDEMEFPSLLCDLPPKTAFDLSLKLNKQEKEEANRVLLVTIDRWKALKNTSPDGLRSGFLMRNGTVERINNDWKLKVEKKSIDVLLDQIPWNLGMVKLPWRRDLWMVDWR